MSPTKIQLGIWADSSTEANIISSIKFNGEEMLDSEVNADNYYRFLHRFKTFHTEDLIRNFEREFFIPSDMVEIIWHGNINSDLKLSLPDRMIISAPWNR